MSDLLLVVLFSLVIFLFCRNSYFKFRAKRLRDLNRIDEDGYLFLTGKISSLPNRMPGNPFPGQTASAFTLQGNGVTLPPMPVPPPAGKYAAPPEHAGLCGASAYSNMPLKASSGSFFSSSYSNMAPPPKAPLRYPSAAAPDGPAVFSPAAKPLGERQFQAPVSGRPVQALNERTVFPAQAPAPKVAEKNPYRAINLVFAIGVSFVFLAGLVFATTTWQNLSTPLRLGLLLLQTILFFGVSTLALKKFNLKNTSIAFFMLGSFFCFVSMVAAGYFQLFGPWLSLKGSGAGLLLSLAFLLVALCGYYGYRQYRSLFFFWVITGGFEASAFSLFWFIFPQKQAFYAASALFACALFILLYWISAFPLPEKIRPMARPFAVWNLLGVSFLASSMFWIGGLSPAAAEVLYLPVVLVCLTRLCLERQYTWIKYLHPFVLLYLAYTALRLVFYSSSWAFPFYLLLMLTALFWAYRLVRIDGKSLQTPVSDLLPTLCILVLSMFHTGDLWSHPMIGVLGFLSLLATTAFLAASQKNTWENSLAAYLFALFLTPFLLALAKYFYKTGGTLLYSQYILPAFLAVYFIAAVLLFAGVPSWVRARFELPLLAGFIGPLFIAQFYRADQWGQAFVNAYDMVFLLPALYGAFRLYYLRKGIPGIIGGWKGVPLLIGTYLSLMAGCLWFIALDSRVLHMIDIRGPYPLDIPSTYALPALAVAAVFWATALRSRLLHPEGPLSKTLFMLNLAVSFPVLLLSTNLLVQNILPNSNQFGIYRFPFQLPHFLILASLFLCYFALVYQHKSGFGFIPSGGALLLCWIFLKAYFLGNSTSEWLERAFVNFTSVFEKEAFIGNLILVFLFAAACLLGRVLHSKVYSRRRNEFTVDWFSAWALLIPFFLTFSDNAAGYSSLRFLLWAFWPLVLLKRTNLVHERQWVATFSLFSLYLAAILTHPLYTFEALLYTEPAMRVAPVLTQAALTAALCLMLRWLVWRKAEPQKANYFVLAGYCFILGSLVFESSRSPMLVYSLPAVLLSSAAFGLYWYIRQKKIPLNASFSALYGGVSIFSSQAAFLFFLWQQAQAPSGITFLLLGLWLGVFLGLYQMKRSVLGLAFPAAAVYFLGLFADRAAASPFPVYGVQAALFCLCFAGSQRMFRKVFFEEEKWPQIDSFLLAGLLPVWGFLSGGSDRLEFFGLLLLAAWVVQGWRKTGDKMISRLQLSAAVLILYAAFLKQPFLQWPRLFQTEIYMLVSILFLLALRHLIWRDFPKQMDWIAFCWAALCIFIQSYDALVYNYLGDSLVLSIAALGILIYACFMRLRRWFILAVLVLAGMALYKTAGFWASLAWWVYLLVAGISLIAIAAANESYRQKGTNLGKKFLSLGFFSQWQW